MSSSNKNQPEMITKTEFIKRMSYDTGFTQANCRIAYDSFVNIMKETLLEGRGLYFIKLGWLEPYIKPPRKMFRLDGNGVMLDENGNKVEYIFPETRWVKFRITQKFKRDMNPGIYDKDEEED